jgi:alpha-ketoglutarate-dependent taurine dioxygenase
VDFTHRTGHPHLNLDAAFVNYASLLAATGKSREQIEAALAELTRPLES